MSDWANCCCCSRYPNVTGWELDCGSYKPDTTPLKIKLPITVMSSGFGTPQVILDF
jgi:hypothetical protein